MEDLHAVSYLKEIVIILAAAGVIVPIFTRLRISPVLGYLIAGFIVGPYGLGSFPSSNTGILQHFVISNPKQVAELANFGVVFLMFMIGLELSTKKLWDLRRIVFGLGMLQVMLTIVVLGFIAWILGNDAIASIILASALALSSTAIVMQILMDRRKLATPFGRSCFSILLFQDLAVVPILILLGIFGAGAVDGISAAVLIALGRAVGVIAFILLVGRFILCPLFRIAGAAVGAEPFMAITLLTVIVTAAVTGMAGLSMALGAFLAGLLLAETPYRHAIEVNIEPFKGLLLGLFFMTVGMELDIRLVEENVFWIFFFVFSLTLLKAAIITPLARLFGLSWGFALEAGLLLGQAGEFAFVIVGGAMAMELLSPATGNFALIVTSLSMMLTPGMAYLARRVREYQEKKERWPYKKTGSADVSDLQGHVIVAGLGRVGDTITRVLDAESTPYIVIDNDAAVVMKKRKAGKVVSYGDASRYELLRIFHPENALAIVLTMDDSITTVRAIKNIRRFWPDILIFARAFDIHVARRLYSVGASVVITETVETSLQIAGSLLKGIGVEEDIILHRLDIERNHALLGISVEL
ncbi:MAG: cation:proton antiporter [Alphaproteobacteria bacterium]|nr:cation:proton antiporter [Alphaproteobacteria bacterium]